MSSGSAQSTSTPSKVRSTGTFLDRIARSTLEKLLSRFEGGRVTLRESGVEHTFGTGSMSQATLEVDILRPRFYRRILLGGSMGAAEAYLDGDWTCRDLTGLIRLLVRNLHVARSMDGGLAWMAGVAARVGHWLRKNTRLGSRRNIAEHYDLGNDFFKLFLDDTMLYSSGIFEHPESTLRDASVAKIDRICQRLELRPGDHLLEIGTGWGGFAVHAAQNYGCRITTTTISKEQYDLACQRIQAAGLSQQIQVVMQDYRDLTGQYDKLVSIEMIEAVGHEFLDAYFQKCGQLLKADGLMLVQAIVMNEQRYTDYLRSTDFIQRHVFPGGCLPSVMAMGQSVARTTDMRLICLEDFAPHYAQTLRHWRSGFWGAIDQVRELGFTERFIRMWHYYLCYCEAAFDERFVGVVQMLFAKAGCRSDVIRELTPRSNSRGVLSASGSSQ